MDNESLQLSLPSYGFTGAQREELGKQIVIWEFMMCQQIFHSPQTNLEYTAVCGVDRCKRSDGKGWRCANRCTAAHQKYCVLHMHRKPPRPRKPVEKKQPQLVNRGFGANQGRSETSNKGFENPSNGSSSVCSRFPSRLGVGSALPTVHQNSPTLFGERGNDHVQQPTEEFGYCGGHWEDFGGPLGEAMCMGPQVSTTVLSLPSEVLPRTSLSQSDVSSICYSPSEFWFP